MRFVSTRPWATWGLGLSLVFSLASCFPPSSTNQTEQTPSNPIAVNPGPESSANPNSSTTGDAANHMPTDQNTGSSATGSETPVTDGSNLTTSPGSGVCSPLVSINSMDASGEPLSPEFLNDAKGYLTLTSTLSCASDVKAVQYMYRLVPEGGFVPLGALQSATNDYRFEINTQALLANGYYELVTKVTLKDGQVLLSAPLPIHVDNATTSGGGGGGGGGSSGGGSNPPSGNVNFELNPTFTVPAGTQKWSLDLGGQVSSTPLVDSAGNSYFAADNTFYVYDADGNKTAELTLSNTVTSPAARFGNFIYFGDTDGNLIKVNISNPENPIKQEISLSSGTQFEYNMPAIDCAGNVYIQTEDRKLFKIDSSGNPTQLLSVSEPALPTGSTLTARYASPVVLGDLVITGTQNGVRIASISGGSEVDSFLPATTVDALGSTHALDPQPGSEDLLAQSVNSPLAIDSNGDAYVVSETGVLYKFNPSSPDANAGTPGDQPIWQTFVGEGDSAPVIGSDNTVYVASENGVLKALNPSTGSSIFEIGLGNVVEFSTPAIGKGSDGKDIVYVGTEGGQFYAINGTNASSAGQQRFVKNLGAPVRSDITIGNDGTVYVGTLDGRMFTLFGDSVGLANSSWPKSQANLNGTGSSCG